VPARYPHRWRLAAAISFIVLGGISLATRRGVTRQAADTDISSVAVDSALPALPALPALASGTAPVVADLNEQAAQGQPEPRVSASGLSIGAAADLSDAQLQRLLNELETVQALPSIELAPTHHPMAMPDNLEDNF
jgi:hypothetical protein